MGYVSIVIGAWLIISSFISNTNNVKSAVVFKVIPFFTGLWNIYIGLYLLGMTVMFK